VSQFETLHRHGLEASTLAAEQPFQRHGMPVEAISVSLPLPDAFAKVSEVAQAISLFSTAAKRGPGRPPAAKRDREGAFIYH
jgi:hypothetical protein